MLPILASSSAPPAQPNELVQLAAGLHLELALIDGDDQIISATPQAQAYLDGMNDSHKRAFLSRVCTLVRANGSAVLTQPDAGIEVYGYVCPSGVSLVFAGVAFPRTPTARGLREVYGLTQAEARVACALASRESPKQIAEHFAIEVSTVRTHLRAIQLKLGATSQTDLIRRLIWSAATFVRDAKAPADTAASPAPMDEAADVDPAAKDVDL